MRIKKIILGFCALTVICWLINLQFNPVAMNGRAITHEVFYLTGVLAWGMMTMAIVIAARPSWIEKITATPMDELYRWHKRLGLAAAALTALHYFNKALIAPVLSLMTLEPVVKASRGELMGWDAFWSSLRGFAVTSSQWATYIGLALLIITFVPWIRYNRWLSWHKLFSLLYLLLSIHCIRLMDAADALTPFGLVNITATVLGLYYSVKLLIVGPGSDKTAKATLSRVVKNQASTLVSLRPDKPLSARSGAFAFVKTPGNEKHPFSIATIAPDGELTFAVKALGDYTGQVVPALQAGQKIDIEGPWGAFYPDWANPRQCWFAGGIGIAPFCAWLNDAAHTHHGDIRLVWCIKSKENDPLYPRVQALADKAGVRLEIYESAKARLDVKTLFSKNMPQKLAVCAGEELALAVIDAFTRGGGDRKAIQREFFQWR